MTAYSYRVAGVVVLFNPADDVINMILSYAGQVEKLYAIDNSVSYNTRIVGQLKSIPNVEYVDNLGNQGIATALNRGASMALADHFNFLLTMDQDTRLKAGYVRELMSAFASNPQERIGIASPRYGARKPRQPNRFEPIFLTMTSGNILNLDAYTAAGPFMDKLFIDHVDHEYCMRLSNAGFRIIQDNESEIIHRPGNVMHVSILGKKLSFSSHSPLRLYYLCRNGFYVARLYRDTFPSFTSFFLRLLARDLCKIPFERERLRRARMICNGYRDYRRGKFGVFQEK